MNYVCKRFDLSFFLVFFGFLAGFFLFSIPLHGSDANFRSLPQRLHELSADDYVKSDGLLDAYQRALKPIDLAPSLEYRKLIDILIKAAKESPDGAGISPDNEIKLSTLGVTRKHLTDPNGRVFAWNLVIDKSAKKKMHIQSAASLASSGYLFIEAYHQLKNNPLFITEQQLFLHAIEKTASEILKYPDENNDGRFGWGRVWFKGRDGLLLHSSDARNSMLFGGYTYFPRSDRQGKPICQKAFPLTEETFDEAHVTLFLLEAYFITRNQELATQILATVGRSFDDTFDVGATSSGYKGDGWVYWKQLRQSDPDGLPKCEVGRVVKNTNLRMATALLAFSLILEHNQDVIKTIPTLKKFLYPKYRQRAFQIIAANNNEIINYNNFGYQGIKSRDIENAQQESPNILIYDRTQKTVSIDATRLSGLKDIIIDGNTRLNKKSRKNVTLCGGEEGTSDADHGISGSCWNHLPFEAEDYFKVLRLTDGWSGVKDENVYLFIDMLTRNLAASKILINGKNGEYQSYFPKTKEWDVSNGIVNATYYGFFCLAKNISSTKVFDQLSSKEQNFFITLDEVCKSLPQSSPSTGVTWAKGYKFNELYLEADRFEIPNDDWSLLKKHN